MPFARRADLPANVRGVLPAEAQDVWRAAFNAADERGEEEETAIRIAWSAVRRAGFVRQSDGTWEREKMQREITLKAQIAKLDEEQQLVFGWLYQAEKADGERVIDHSGEFVRPETLEKAAYRYVLEHRKGGVMHEREGGAARVVGRLVECVVTTREKQRAMGLADGALPVGIWCGWKIDDPETWARYKSGELRMLSLGGLAVRA